MLARTMFDELNDFRRTFDRMFNAFYNTAGPSGQSSQPDFNFVPAVETGWTDDYLNLRVVLPGVKQEDLKMTIQGNQLTIQGERKTPQDFGKEGTIYNQLAYGKFERSLTLPDGLDIDKLQAHLHDGLLDIRVPVAQAVKPRQVPISVAGGETKKSIAA